MEWLVKRNRIAKELIETTEIDLKKDHISVYSYVLTDRKYVGTVNDTIKTNLLTEIVCEVYEVDKSLIFSKNRKRNLVDARHCLAYFLRRNTKYSFAIIGKIMASPIRKRDHATILNSVNVYNDLLDTEDYHKRRTLIIQKEYNKRISDIDLTNTYISNSTDVIANWENIKHRY